MERGTKPSFALHVSIHCHYPFITAKMDRTVRNLLVAAVCLLVLGGLGVFAAVRQAARPVGAVIGEHCQRIRQLLYQRAGRDGPAHQRRHRAGAGHPAPKARACASWKPG